MFAGRGGIEVPAVVDGAGFGGERGGDFMDEVDVPRCRHGNAGGEQRGGPVPLHAVEALIPLVGPDAEAFDRGPPVVQQDRLFLQRQASNEVIQAAFNRQGNVAEQFGGFGGRSGPGEPQPQSDEPSER